MDEKQIEDFTRWCGNHPNWREVAHEAARRFGVSAEDKAVIEAAERWKLTYTGTSTDAGPIAQRLLDRAVDARHKAQEPKPRFEKFELGIMDRHTNEFISLFDETGRVKLLALLNQAHETERGK